MKAAAWTRRDVIRSTVQIASGLGLAHLSELAASASSPSHGEESRADDYTFIVTTEGEAWQKGSLSKTPFSWDMLNLNIGPEELEQAAKTPQKIDGFGACFNELGWTSLSRLTDRDRETVLHELFDPDAGARLTYCRMPIGANDFARAYYSYDEVPGDFSLEHFSIANDQDTLIPFIKAALHFQPELRLWASPWTPPSWMKRNGFYAEAKAYPGMKDNGIRPDQVGHEGQDMFFQEPCYLEAYARYFGRFIDEYKKNDIRVGMVMPQNEFNSAQNFPSCTWTPEGLAHFLEYLIPEMTKRDVEVFFGTLERGNVNLLKTVLADEKIASHIKGLGLQWAAKNALPEIHSLYPGLRIYQSEQECGDGTNSWTYSGYCWQLMKAYFRNGARAYMYWNLSTDAGGKSAWGWAQNSLVTVDPAEKSFRFNHDYYLLKHLTHFVDVGAKYLNTNGTCDDALGFVNPDGTVVLLVRNELDTKRLVQVKLKSRTLTLELPADSIGTLSVKP
jgi:glucosylceramidase